MIIKWNELALQQFESAIEWIEMDSPANAEKVKRAILLKIDELQHHPKSIRPISTS
jgi:plasmid stabilization system protein ParE